MKAARFGFETGPSYAGFHEDVTWNGWACPVFTRETVESMIVPGGCFDGSPGRLRGVFEGDVFVLYGEGCKVADLAAEVDSRTELRSDSTLGDVYDMAGLTWIEYED